MKEQIKHVSLVKALALPWGTYHLPEPGEAPTPDCPELASNVDAFRRSGLSTLRYALISVYNFCILVETYLVLFHRPEFTRACVHESMTSGIALKIAQDLLYTTTPDNNSG